MGPDRDLLASLARADLLVGSGVYELAVPGAVTTLDQRGLPVTTFPTRTLTDRELDDVLRLSAFARVAESEHEISARLFGSEPGIKTHPVAGCHVGAYAGAVADDQVRARSSSGGLTTWFLRALLLEGRVDGVIHMKDSASGVGSLFGYAVSRSVKELESGAKTKYFPGHVGTQLKEAMESDERFAIVGIPSVLYEVRLATLRYPELAARLPYFVGLICGHQKSARYADALAWQVGIQPGRLDAIDFRVKLEGRKANSYGVEFRGRDAAGNDVHETRAASELYGTDWGLGYFKANFSDYTDDVFNETADVVFGDAWLPEYIADTRGHNVVLSRTQEVNDILLRGRLKGAIELDDLDVVQVVKSQGGLVRHSRELLSTRLSYLESRGEFVPPQRLPQQPPADLPRRRLQQLRIRMSRKSHRAFMSAVEVGNFETFSRRMRWLEREYKFAYKLVGLAGRLRS